MCFGVATIDVTVAPRWAVYVELWISSARTTQDAPPCVGLYSNFRAARPTLIWQNRLYMRIVFSCTSLALPVLKAPCGRHPLVCSWGGWVGAVGWTPLTSERSRVDQKLVGTMEFAIACQEELQQQQYEYEVKHYEMQKKFNEERADKMS